MNSVIAETTQSAVRGLEQINTVIQIVIAISTFIAVIVALFQETIRRKFQKTRIKVEILKRPPDCHQILLTDQRTGTPIANALYVRMKVSNIGKENPSKETEVFLSNVWEVKSDGTKDNVKTILPMNLKWSHTHNISAQVLPDTNRHCDLGAFVQSEGKTIFFLETIVQPNVISGGVVPNTLQAGKYLLEIIISGINIKPQRKYWELEFSPTWSEDENEMLQNNIKIKETNI